jgi:hypothetical protein
MGLSIKILKNTEMWPSGKNQYLRNNFSKLVQPRNLDRALDRVIKKLQNQPKTKKFHPVKKNFLAATR